MSITLSSGDLAQLTRAIQLLVSPLDHATVDHWRSAVNQHLKELLNADSVGFLLPVSEGLMLYSEEHDAEALSAYPEVVPPDMADGTPLWEQMIRSRVDTLANMYGRHYHRYVGSAYYNEYAGANGAHDTLAAAVSLGGMDAKTVACLQFWHERADGRLFGEREVALLRVLFPAFVAGVDAHVRWGGQRQELLRTLDHLNSPALVCDLTGKLLHVTPSLDALLGLAAEAEFLRAEMLAIVREVCRSVTGRCMHDGVASEGFVRELRTGGERYRASGTFAGSHSGSGGGYVVAGLERMTPVRRSEEELRELFSLTRAEVRVALLLGDGGSNAEIAQELFISPHTARRHTERVLQKMGLGSRSDVRAQLYA